MEEGRSFEKRRLWRRVAWLVGALVVVGLLIWAWRPKPVPVDMARVVREPLMVTVEEEGTTRVVERHTISAPQAGMLERIALQAGDTVREGEPVATIQAAPSVLLDPRSRAQASAHLASARANFEQARAAVTQVRHALDAARREERRTRALVRRGVATRQQAQEARDQVRALMAQSTAARYAQEAARFEVQAAQSALEQVQAPEGTRPQTLKVTSTTDGVVLRVLQPSAGAVQPGAPLLELGNLGQLEVVVGVLTTQAVRIEPGQSAWLTRWGGARDIQAEVQRLEPSAYTRLSSLGVEEQRVNVILEPLLDPDNDQGRPMALLGDGYRLDARIVTWQAEDVVQVDASAVFRSRAGWAVYRVEDGRARLRPVQTGARTDQRVQILRGLEPGDAVILYPSERVGEDVRVEAREPPS